MTSVPAPAPAGGCRVLVADDQREIIESVRLALSTHGMTVIGATTPAEAVSAAKAHSVDAALVDLNYEKGRTSGEQGLDLVSTLHRQSPALPIVVMTAWSSIDLALEAMRRGARDFIEKPWEEPRLVGLLRSHAELGRALRRVSELEDEVKTLRTGPVNLAEPEAMGGMRLMEVEGVLVRKAMERHQGNVSRAARTLGLSRSALYRRLDRHKI
jgi:DNA-binding NtrC family response regulator